MNLLSFTFFAFSLSLNAQTTVIPQLLKGAPILENQYGLTSHITWHGFEYDDYKQNVDLIKQSGNKIIRTDFSAENLGWDRGKADYTIWDNVYNEIVSAELQMLPMIYCNPKTLTKGSNGSLKEYVTTCVSRYGKHVAGWEIGNEKDLENAKDGSIPPTEYLEVLRETYNVIKKTNPNNNVLIGAIGLLDNHYLEELLSYKAEDCFDILSIHHYCSFNVPESIMSFYLKLDSLLKRYNFDKPVWLTETGYKSYQGSADQELFYSELLPSVYKRLGIDTKKYSMGLFYDKRINNNCTNQDNSSIYSGFKSCHLVYPEELKELSVRKCPVLMVLYKEFFPDCYFDDLRAYIQKGGTVVFPECGALLFNELDINTKKLTPVGKKYYEPLHINCMFEWDTEAIMNRVQRITKIKAVSEQDVQYTWHADDLSNPIYLLDNNLEKGDEMIPIVYAEDVEYKGVVAACYRLNSDLKGNIIIQTRRNHSVYVSESQQAARLPRNLLLSYAIGVDKVLPYCLRDREKDCGYGIINVNEDKKASFYTLRALTRFLPSGSSRPKIINDDNQYIASWIMPDGEKVYCVWSSWVGVSNSIRVRGNARFYDEKGQRIRRKHFKVSPNLTYILGARTVGFL